MLIILFRYLLQYQEPIPCEQLVTALCDIKQAYTQFGGNIFLYLSKKTLNSYGSVLQLVGQDPTGVTKPHFGGRSNLSKSVQERVWVFELLRRAWCNIFVFYLTFIL